MTKRINFWACFLLVFTLSSCSFYEEVEFLGVQDYSFENYEDSQVKVSLDIKINNPNFYSIKVKKSDFEVFLGDNKLGDAKMLNDLKIEKKLEADYTLELLLDKKEVRKSVLPLATKLLTQKTITFRVKGKPKCTAMGVIGKKFDIDEKKNISIKELINKFSF